MGVVLLISTGTCAGTALHLTQWLQGLLFDAPSAS